MTCKAAQLQAGVAKADITDRTVPVNDPLFAKALVLRSGNTTAVIITVDAVAIGEIGRIKNDFLTNVRAQLQKELNIQPSHVLINASHCHGIVCADVEQRTVQVVRDACRNLVPVKVGAGRGHEDRVAENRRLKLKDGTETDVRHAYSTAPDEEIVGTGPVDTEIGLLRLDKLNGQPLAVIYNFAVHPIQGVPSRGNTADITGFASKAIEDDLGDSALALFLQGACGDINPVRYKDVHNPRDAAPLGNMLGYSALQALRKIQTRETGELRVINEILALPRAADFDRRIAALQAEQTKLSQSLRGTSLNLKTFTELFPQYKEGKLDAEKRANMEAYIRNVHTMEKLTRLQVNLALLKKHQAKNAAAGKPTIDVEIMGVRIGDFVLLTFPGELTVEIGLNIKKRAPAPFTFVAGYTNGYIYYAPTARGRNNKGFAQEDCDCLLAPEWQKLFEDKVAAILKCL
ncbi:MAG: hypothetical protein FJ395_18300 [Verrucomicrobia bacterium]|nr:hypothetical protein [Verrucomicrobiota bacterium]